MQSLTPAQHHQLQQWLRQSMNPDYARRMAAPLVQQTSPTTKFPVQGTVLPFADGVLAMKSLAAHGPFRDQGMYRDVASLYQTPLSAEEWRRWLRTSRFKPASPNSPLYAALVDGSCGFYTLTQAEYEALRAPVRRHRVAFRGDLACSHMYQSIPIGALAALDYPAFLEEVSLVRTELGLPPQLPACVQARLHSEAKKQGKDIAMASPVARAGDYDALRPDEATRTSAWAAMLTKTQPTPKRIEQPRPTGKRKAHGPVFDMARYEMPMSPATQRFADKAKATMEQAKTLLDRAQDARNTVATLRNEIGIGWSSSPAVEAAENTAKRLIRAAEETLCRAQLPLDAALASHAASITMEREKWLAEQGGIKR